LSSSDDSRFASSRFASISRASRRARTRRRVLVVDQRLVEPRAAHAALDERARAEHRVYK